MGSRIGVVTAPEPSRADDAARRRRGKNLAVAAILVGLVVLFYLVTLVKLSGTGG